MADELEALCGKISLTEGEQTGIQVEELEVSDARAVAGKCLVGKVWGDKNVNKEAFMSVMSTIWRTAGGVKFRDLKDNMWLFEFTDQVDKMRVMDGRPWSYDRQILVLNEFDGTTPPSQLVFNHSPFWIQAHDMPLICMNKNVGTKIGNSMGELLEVDVAGDGMGWGSYLRLRVNIDITKPLERGRALNLNGKTSWVEFKYEKLPLFCFRCGRLVHGPRGCPVPPKTRLSAADEPKAWGTWLRAADPRRRGTRGVAGFREEWSPNQNREEEEEGGRSPGRSTRRGTSAFHGNREVDGAQSREGFSRKGKPDSHGNPTQQVTAEEPAGSEVSGTHQLREASEVLLRKELSPCLLGNRGRRGDVEESYKGFDEDRVIGLKEMVGRGSFNIEDNCGVQAAGPAQEENEATSMDYRFVGVSAQGEEVTHAVALIPKQSVKTWKRRARKQNESDPVITDREMNKKGKRGVVE
jgi:hypothetical protein